MKKINKIIFFLKFRQVDILNTSAEYITYIIERELLGWKKFKEQSINVVKFIEYTTARSYIPEKAVIEVVQKNKFDIPIKTKYRITESDMNIFVTQNNIIDGQFLHRHQIEKAIMDGWMVLLK